MLNWCVSSSSNVSRSYSLIVRSTAVVMRHLMNSLLSQKKQGEEGLRKSEPPSSRERSLSKAKG